jgi:hypothetical protein
MAFRDPPQSAAWLQKGTRDGFEVAIFTKRDGGQRIEGQAAAVEIDESWMTRGAHVMGQSASGTQEIAIEADGTGGWLLNGEPVADVEGCLDVDLEASAFTNAMPVHRLGLEIGDRADAPAAWVRARDLRVERLEQTYSRIEDEGGRQRFRYAAPAFDFEAELLFDESGLVLDYPGIATRTA